LVAGVSGSHDGVASGDVSGCSEWNEQRVKELDVHVQGNHQERAIPFGCDETRGDEMR
jgi:hypothetical protein